MLEKDIGKILEETFSSGSDVRLKVTRYLHLCCTNHLSVLCVLNHFIDQMQALQNMYDYLLDAESQLGTDTTSNSVADCSVEGGNAVPVAAGAGDTNICGGIVQLYWDNILERCLDFNEQIRNSALKVSIGFYLLFPALCVCVCDFIPLLRSNGTIYKKGRNKQWNKPGA